MGWQSLLHIAGPSVEWLNYDFTMDVAWSYISISSV